MSMIDEKLIQQYSKIISLLDQDDPEYFGKMMDVTDSFLEINDLLKSSSQPKLEDLREGPHSGCTLNQAEEKLAFNLQNDRDLYNLYKYNMVSAIATEFVESSSVTIQDGASLEFLIEICEKAAQEILDSYIEELVD